MKSFIGNAKRFLVDQFMALSRLAFLEGRLDAQRDLAEDRIGIRTYGRPAKWRDTYAELLRDKYHVELRPIAGEDVSSRQRAESHGYNSVMKPVIRKKYGHDFLEKVVDQAKELHQKNENAAKHSSE